MQNKALNLDNMKYHSVVPHSYSFDQVNKVGEDCVEKLG